MIIVKLSCGCHNLGKDDYHIGSPTTCVNNTSHGVQTVVERNPHSTHQYTGTQHYKPGDRVIITKIPTADTGLCVYGGVHVGMKAAVVVDGAGQVKIRTERGIEFYWPAYAMALDFGPDTNSLIYWVRKLVHADCGDDAVRAVAELAKIERRLPQ